MAELETPGDLESIYLARGDEVGAYRPTFTGDIYRIDSGHLVMVLQHPCALRRGVDLHPRVLVATVTPVSNGRLPSKWTGSYKIMPLPKLIGNTDHSASFVDLELLESATIPDIERVAVLSQVGVNLLMQRWTFHNTRLEVPTYRYSESTIGPFDEADLIEEWVEERVGGGADPLGAERECAGWLDVRTTERTRRELLGDAQHASSVRREARAHRKAVKFDQ
ncbi:hypothetical protein [Mycolicibacterium gilvum]|uniref:hypothetical protein n=1 Tax=Mycolicibacterium gilvum TaxID=1804 RepID=UPI004045CE14